MFCNRVILLPDTTSCIESYILIYSVLTFSWCGVALWHLWPALYSLKDWTKSVVAPLLRGHIRARSISWPQVSDLGHRVSVCCSAQLFTCLTSKWDVDAANIGVSQRRTSAEGLTFSNQSNIETKLSRQSVASGKGGAEAIFKVFISIMERETLSWPGSPTFRRGGQFVIIVSVWKKEGDEGLLAVYLYPSCLTSYRSDRRANWKLLSHRILHSSIFARNLFLQNNQK